MGNKNYVWRIFKDVEVIQIFGWLLSDQASNLILWYLREKKCSKEICILRQRKTRNVSIFVVANDTYIS